MAGNDNLYQSGGEMNNTAVSCSSLAPELPGGLRPEDSAVFMCRTCFSVFGDSLSVCGEDERLGVLLCVRVTEDVTIGESLHFGVDGALKGCAYHPLRCRSCGSNIGFNLHSSCRTYAYLRGLFCLFKQSLSCYLFKSKTVVPGKELHFELTSLQEQIKQLKAELVNTHKRVQLLTMQLEQHPTYQENVYK
ncbi:protein Mis18-beta [Discoglossus pictus]